MVMRVEPHGGRNGLRSREPWVIASVGGAVRTIDVGDRVVLPFNVSCGYCFNCTCGYTNACLTTNPDAHSWIRVSRNGPHRGGQAEFVVCRTRTATVSSSPVNLVTSSRMTFTHHFHVHDAYPRMRVTCAPYDVSTRVRVIQLPGPLVIGAGCRGLHLFLAFSEAIGQSLRRRPRDLGGLGTAAPIILHTSAGSTRRSAPFDATRSCCTFFSYDGLAQESTPCLRPALRYRWARRRAAPRGPL